MSVKLKSPKQAVAIDRMRIAKYEIENNPFMGTRWIQLWLVLGRYSTPGDAKTFEQYIDPVTGEPAMGVKLETGMHPLRDGTALGKCDACGKWHQKTTGPCDLTKTPSCAGTVKPYDGFQRLSETFVQAMRTACYQFLTSEEVPDPDDFDKMVKLMDGTLEEV